MGASEPVRGRRPRRNQAIIERDLEIYKCSMRGESIRAIGEKFQLKSPNTVVLAIRRGKDHAIAKGIDVESHRLQINELFEQTVQAVALQVQEQARDGLVTTITDPDGGVMTKKVRGIDPRLAAELGRSLHRWSEFLGLMDRAPEQNVQATTVVLTSPAAGADFESRYGGQALQPAADQQTIDTAAVPVKETVVSEGGPGWGEPDAAA